MTHQNLYSIKGAKQHNQDDLTLYEAIKALNAINWTAGNAPNWDTVNIKRGGRCVAYFCAWHDKVAPTRWTNGRGATPQEQHMVDHCGTAGRIS